MSHSKDEKKPVNPMLKNILEQTTVKQEEQNRLQQAKQKKSVEATRRGEVEQEEERKSRELWETALKAAKDMIEKGLQGYDTWLAAMNSILILCGKYLDAMAASNPLGTLFNMAYETIQAHKDPTIKPVDLSTLTLPGIKQFVKFEDNKLVEGSLSENLRTSGNGPITINPKFQADAEQCLRAGVDRWLKDIHHCEIQQGGDPNTYFKADGTLLTTAEFNSYRDDPEKGFNAFFQNYCGLASKQEEAHVEQPAPRP